MSSDLRLLGRQSLISVLLILGTANAAFADCGTFLDWTEEERRTFLAGWITGTGMITQDLRLNIYSKRIQLAVEERIPCSDRDCEIVSRADHAIKRMNSNYRDVLLASRHRDDFYAAMNEYCESSYGPGTSLSEAIPVTLGNMARTGKYSLLEHGIVLNGEERIAEMYSSQFVGGTLGGGRSIRASRLSALCDTKANPVFLQGQQTVSLTVGDHIGLDEIHIDAFDQDGKFVRGVPLRIREENWLENTRFIKADYDARYVTLTALQAGEIELEAISLCPQEPANAKSIRLIISEP
ncbi:MAG: hypothetical protein OEM63_04695 [Gammaproteobacteria bacterium]|nr:hypothetical protein [Gammaproteobacteria bacterium]